MIELTDIKCGYGKKVVLKRIDLRVKEGELTCLLGKNGAGKTTLFKVIMGFLKPMEGQVQIDGKDLNRFSPKQLARYISYVPQAHNTPFPFSVLSVVLMGQYSYTDKLFGQPGKKSYQIATESLQLLGIEHLKDKAFTALSGGEKQMVLIARALAQRPVFIAMDEPTSNLDVGNAIKVMKVASLLRSKGYGIIMNTHSPEQVLNYADQAVLLKDGKIRALGNPDKIMNTQTISEIYNTGIELVNACGCNGQIHRVCVPL